MTSRHELHRRAHAIATGLATITPDLDRLIATITDHLAGQPAARTFETDRTSGHTTVTDDHGNPMPSVSDPTGEAAIRPDHAATDLQHVASTLRNAHTAIDHLLRIRDRYLNTTAPGGGEPSCDLCHQTTDDHGRPGWSPIHIHATTINGTLPRPMAVCRWHHRFIRKTGRLPNRAETKAHLAGHRVPTPPSP